MKIKIKCDQPVQMVKIADLKPNPRNPNFHPKSQIEELKRQIIYQGIREPIKVSTLSGMIVTGHGKLQAAKELELKEFPVQYQDFDNAEMEYAHLVADNAIALQAELDKSMINIDIQDLGPELDIEMLAIPDFKVDMSEYDREEKEDDVPDPKDLICKEGDLWQLGDHRLLCGDCTNQENIDRLMDGQKADMVFTDPPYGVSYEKKTREIANQRKNPLPIKNDEMKVDDIAKSIWLPAFNNTAIYSSDSASIYMTMPQGGDQMMMMMMMKASWNVKHELIWLKSHPVFSMGRLDYDYKHEPIIYGWKKKHAFYGNGKFKNSVWEIDRESNKLHPTTKPIALIENALLNSSNKGMICLDPFGGSGSTLIACEKTNRKCFMMEIDPHYCDVIIERWQQYTGNKARKL